MQLILPVNHQSEQKFSKNFTSIKKRLKDFPDLICGKKDQCFKCLMPDQIQHHFAGSPNRVILEMGQYDNRCNYNLCHSDTKQCHGNSNGLSLGISYNQPDNLNKPITITQKTNTKKTSALTLSLQTSGTNL